MTNEESIEKYMSLWSLARRDVGSDHISEAINGLLLIELIDVLKQISKQISKPGNDSIGQSMAEHYKP